MPFWSELNDAAVRQRLGAVISFDETHLPCSFRSVIFRASAGRDARLATDLWCEVWPSQGSRHLLTGVLSRERAYSPWQDRGICWRVGESGRSATRDTDNYVSYCTWTCLLTE